MAWIEYHTELRDHWKIQRLADAQDIAYPHALGLVSCLWLWAVYNAPMGNVSKFNDVELCRAARATSVFEIKKILTDCELLDAHGCINDWHKHGLKYLQSAKLRMKRYRNTRRNVQRNRDVTVRSTQPYPTLPNLTKDIVPQKAGESNHLKNGKTATSLQDLIKYWKGLEGISTEGEASSLWDKAHFPRHSKTAKLLLAQFGGDLEKTTEAVSSIRVDLINLKLAYTFETIQKRAASYGKKEVLSWEEQSVIRREQKMNAL